MRRYSRASAISRKDSIEHARHVMKKIFLSFIVTLPIFHTLFLVFEKKSVRRPSPEDLYRDHSLAG